MATSKSKIEQIIDEIEDYIENCKFQPFSSEKIIVNKEELEELLSELRLKTPDEIKKYQKIINNKEAIINDAKERADAMIQEATAHITELVSEHEIMQQAYKQANDVVDEASRQAQEILDAATNDANNIRMGAIQYTDDSLANIQNIMSYAMQEITDRYNALMNSMSNSLDVVNANRSELHAANEEPTEDDVDVDVDDILDEADQ